MKNSYDQKKGSADRANTCQKQGMDGGNIGNSMGTGSSSSSASNSSRNAGGRSSHAQGERSSTAQKTARHGSASNES
jgi:hypothetical protein